MKYQIPFRYGDVVRFKRDKTKRHTYIVATQVMAGEIEYATSGSAWHTHSELILVRECDQESMKHMYEYHDLNRDYEEEDEEEEEC